MMFRVLLGAHTIHPGLGGEAGNGWGWAEALARHPRIGRVEVLAHPMSREAVEQRLASDPSLAAKLRFHWVLPPARIDPWKGDVPGKKQWHRLLAHYLLWQHAAERVARMMVGQIDVAHHVTPGTILLRSFVSRLGVPYIIGPVGGGQAAPLSVAVRLFAQTRDVHGAIEVARSILVKPASRRRSLRQSLSQATAVLCANDQTLRLARRYQSRSERMIDGGIDELPAQRAVLSASKPIVLWVGKLEARKDPLAALRVAEVLRSSLPAAGLLMVGDGWLHDRVNAEVASRGLENVTLLGSVEHGRLAQLYASASIFLFTSVRDTFGVQNLEAMTYGLPIVYRESSGVGVGDFAGASSTGVPAGTDWASVTAQVIAALVLDKEAWKARSDAARDAAAAFTWSSKADRAVRLYELALSSLPLHTAKAMG
jgi:glycosyltransferase involved in cell wall biosynthesis